MKLPAHVRHESLREVLPTSDLDRIADWLVDARCAIDRGSEEFSDYAGECIDNAEATLTRARVAAAKEEPKP